MRAGARADLALRERELAALRAAHAALDRSAVPAGALGTDPEGLGRAEAGEPPASGSPGSSGAHAPAEHARAGGGPPAAGPPGAVPRGPAAIVTANCSSPSRGAAPGSPFASRIVVPVKDRERALSRAGAEKAAAAETAAKRRALDALGALRRKPSGPGQGPGSPVAGSPRAMAARPAQAPRGCGAGPAAGASRADAGAEHVVAVAAERDAALVEAARLSAALAELQAALVGLEPGPGRAAAAGWREQTADAGTSTASLAAGAAPRARAGAGSQAGCAADEALAPGPGRAPACAWADAVVQAAQAGRGVGRGAADALQQTLASAASPEVQTLGLTAEGVRELEARAAAAGGAAAAAATDLAAARAAAAPAAAMTAHDHQARRTHVPHPATGTR